MNTFTTLYGRIIVAEGSLREKRTKRSTQVWVYAGKLLLFCLALLFLGVTIYDLFDGEGRVLRRLSRPFMALLFITSYWKEVYRILFRVSWKGTIRLDEIRKVTTLPLKNGLETAAVLHLSSGREKRYIFRNREGQLEPFKEVVSGE